MVPLQIKDMMIEDVVQVRSGESVRQLLQLLVDNKIGGVPVLDKESHLLGMISDGDVLRALSPREQTIYSAWVLVFTVEKQEMEESIQEQLDRTVDQLMNDRKLYYVYPDDDIEQVLKILSKHHFKKIPVIDHHDKVVGVISRGDVIRYITNQMIGE